MGVQCQKCGHVNDRLGSKRFCEVCNARLHESIQTRSPQTERLGRETNSVITEIPIDQEFKRFSQSNDLPKYTPFAFPHIENPIDNLAGQENQSISNYTPPSQVGVQSPVHLRGNLIEGTVIQIDQLQSERSDPDVARILFSIILTVDIFIILGSIALYIIIAFIIITFLAALLNAMWITTILGFIMQSFFYFLSPIFSGLFRNRQDQQLVPVTNYTVRIPGGATRTFRVKGQLRGATIQLGDRVQVSGRPRHGILRFSRGTKLDTGEPLLRPTNWHILWLLILIIANLFGYLMLEGYL